MVKRLFCVEILRILFISIVLLNLTKHGYAETGRFVGELITKWLDDGRNMELVEDYGFVDPKNKKWNVPSGAVVNGASIPRLLWTFIGSPFSDTYRNASVIHDHYVVTRTETWQDVHLMFYDAMIASGVPQTRANIMYLAVERFGPRWKFKKEVGQTCKRVNGKIDFGSCTYNSAQEIPELINKEFNKSDLKNFLDEFDNGELGEVAEEWKLMLK